MKGTTTEQLKLEMGAKKYETVANVLQKREVPGMRQCPTCKHFVAHSVWEHHKRRHAENSLKQKGVRADVREKP